MASSALAATPSSVVQANEHNAHHRGSFLYSIVRALNVGIFFGVPLGVCTPLSALFRNSLERNSNVHLLLGHCMLSSFFITSAAYWFFVEPSSSSWSMQKERKGKWLSVFQRESKELQEDQQQQQQQQLVRITPPSRQTIVPYLNGFNAVIPAWSYFVAGHLFYPGMFVLVHEPTAALKRQEYFRMTLKVTLAFGPSHFVFVTVYAATVGTLFKVLRNFRAK